MDWEEMSRHLFHGAWWEGNREQFKSPEKIKESKDGFADGHKVALLVGGVVLLVYNPLLLIPYLVGYLVYRDYKIRW